MTHRCPYCGIENESPDRFCSQEHRAAFDRVKRMDMAELKAREPERRPPNQKERRE